MFKFLQLLKSSLKSFREKRASERVSGRAWRRDLEKPGAKQFGGAWVFTDLNPALPLKDCTVDRSMQMWEKQKKGKLAFV